MTSNEHEQKVHTPEVCNLPGALIDVHQPFGEQHYYALAYVDGRYPEQGKIAHDINRREYMELLDGDIRLTVNDVNHIMRLRSAILVDTGDYYFIEGKGRMMVFVEDQNDATTQIEDLKQGQ